MPRTRGAGPSVGRRFPLRDRPGPGPAEGRGWIPAIAPGGGVPMDRLRRASLATPGPPAAGSRGSGPARGRCGGRRGARRRPPSRGSDPRASPPLGRMGAVPRRGRRREGSASVLATSAPSDAGTGDDTPRPEAIASAGVSSGRRAMARTPTLADRDPAPASDGEPGRRPASAPPPRGPRRPARGGRGGEIGATGRDPRARTSAERGGTPDMARSIEPPPLSATSRRPFAAIERPPIGSPQDTEGSTGPRIASTSTAIPVSSVGGAPMKSVTRVGVGPRPPPVIRAVPTASIRTDATVSARMQRVAGPVDHHRGQGGDRPDAGRRTSARSAGANAARRPPRGRRRSRPSRRDRRR